MTGEINLNKLLQTMKPVLNAGEYVFCSVNNLSRIDSTDILLSFKEKEGITIITDKTIADKLNLEYSFIAAWITLTVHSSLEAVGLTAAFSKALTDANISCNVVSGYYHDHIFVNIQDAKKSIDILNRLSEIK